MSDDKRVAVVTGANRGIGLEVCRQFAKKGFQVVLTSRDEQKGLKAVQHHLELTKKFPMTRWKIVPALTVGFLLQNREKYSGALRREDQQEFQFLFRPNLEF